MAGDFVHLHTHSYFSLLAGGAPPEALVARAAALGQPAVALTDANNMFGAVRFYRAAKAAGVKPIFGLQLAVGPEGRPLVLLAETEIGYRHLLQLATAVRTEPKTDRGRRRRGLISGSAYGDGGAVEAATVWSRADGLIVLTGGSEGELAARTAAGDGRRAREWVETLKDAFGPENVFVELQNQGLAGQAELNGSLTGVARAAGVGVVATNDVRYVDPADARAHAALLALGAGTTWDDPRRPSLGSDRFHFASAEDMRARFPGMEEAIRTAVAVADRCSVSLELGRPRLPVYRDRAGAEPLRLLSERVFEGAVRRSGGPPEAETAARLRHELDIIGARGFASYFLIVADIVGEAKRRGIPVGPGRGSAAGSLVAYCLGITEVDPLAHGLLFERFLNPRRATMPDIDLDVADRGREEVLAYIRRRFGQDRVAQIATFGTLAARAAVREAGRLLGGEAASAADRVAGRLPTGPGVALADAWSRSEGLRRLVRQDKDAARVLALARAVEGAPRHVSVHAAGVVIGDGPLGDHVPLLVTAEGVRVTQYPMDDVEALGFLKMDVLGLRTLTVVDEARRGSGADGEGEAGGGFPGPAGGGADVDDPAVYAALRRQGADGIFQLETRMFRRLVERLQPESFDDVVALLALGRPGPMQRVDEFIRRRRGEARPVYAHAALEPILRETYGLIVYQEQVMRIAMDIGGFDAAEADLLRRSLADGGGGGGEGWQRERERFVRGAAARGLTTAEGERVWSELVRFAGYGFAKSHSVAYGLLTYETARLRTYRPGPFLAALLNSHMHRPDRIDRYVRSARGWGVDVAPPDVNGSGVAFAPAPGRVDRVVYGLAAVRHVGRGGAEAVVKARNDRPFASLDDLADRFAAAGGRPRTLEALIRAGACDAFGEEREAMLRRVAEGAGDRRQGSLFPSRSATSAGKRSGDSPSRAEIDIIKRLSGEIVLKLSPRAAGALPGLRRLLAAHRGDVPVRLHVPAADGRTVVVEVDRCLWVRDGPQLRRELQALAASGAFTVGGSAP